MHRLRSRHVPRAWYAYIIIHIIFMTRATLLAWLTVSSRPHIAQLVGGGGRAQFCDHERADRRGIGRVLDCNSAHACGRTRSAVRLGRSRYVHAPAYGTLQHRSFVCLSFRKHFVSAPDVQGCVIRLWPVTSITIDYLMPAGRSAEAKGSHDEAKRANPNFGNLIGEP